MSMDILKRQIKDKKIDRLYLFFGEEEYLINYYIKEIQKIIVPSGTEDFNLAVVEGKDGIDGILPICESLPVFAERKLVIVKESGVFRKQGNSELEQFFQNVPDYICIVFCESEVDKRLKLYKLAEKAGTVVEFSYQEPKTLAKWIIKGFGLKGKNIDYDTAMLLVEYSEPGMTSIYNEIEKITVFLGDRNTVTPADIEAVCIKTLKSRIFDLTDAVAARDSRKALSLLNDMINLKEPVPRIMYMIVRQLRQIFETKYLLKNKATRDDIARVLGVSSFVAGKLEKQARYFSEEDIKKYVKICLETDENIKTWRINDRTAVELLLGDIISKK